MGSNENITSDDVESKVGINTEENSLKTSELKEDEPGTKSGNVKTAHPFPHPRRESSIKTKSVLKQGHLRVKEDGQKVYKKTPSYAIMAATQLGIGYSVGRLSARQERDILMVDFYFVEKVWFPGAGTKETPSHKHNDFRFKSYAPMAFRYFRDLFHIQPSDFLLSLASEPIKEITNPGASGSLFYVSNDDMFIVKTVQHKEATFLQQLLPGYYMNIHQNPRTLLPKFFGLYCYQSGTSNIRLTVMNNLLPSQYKCHKKFDLKGSTYKRKASKAEQNKKSPIWKDLDYQQQFPNGILLDSETYDAVIKTISRDIRVLESFNIMDYSFLLGIHNIDEAEREKQVNRANTLSQEGKLKSNPDREARTNEFGAALEAIPLTDDDDDKVRPHGGVPAKNDEGERLILFMGIIDILQSYRLAKKMEHSWKSLLTDGDTVSVHKPSFYSSRFLNFIKDEVFFRCAVQRTNTKKRIERTSGNLEYKAETLIEKNEKPVMESDELAPKRDSMVKILETQLNGSIDYLSTEIDSIDSSDDLLDRGSTSDDLSPEASIDGFYLQDNKEVNNDNCMATNVETDVGIVLISNNAVSDCNITEASNTYDVNSGSGVIDINDIKFTTTNEKDTISHNGAYLNTEKFIHKSVKIEIKENGELVDRPTTPLVEDSHL